MASTTKEDKMPFAAGAEKCKNTPWFQKYGRRDVFYASFILFVHILCLFAPSTFSWGAFVSALTVYIVCGLFGINLTYHRSLTHRGFKLPKYLEYLFAYFGNLAHQGDPIYWVSIHRNHHKYTDTELDPHSPIEGFCFSHILWIFNHDRLIQKGVNVKNATDLTRQRYYQFLRKTSGLHTCMMAAALYSLGGFPFIVWGMGVAGVWGYHITFLVNSVGHTWGHQAWNTKDMSRNVWYLSLFTFGESWHNNHHAFEFSARHGLEWWQLDPTWYLIKTLEYLGLATDVKVPSHKHKQKMALQNGIQAQSAEN